MKAEIMSNTKTRRNIFLAVIAVVVVAVLLLAGTVFLTHNFIWYEKGYHPDPDSWVGLTREEILDLAFKEFPICRRGGLHVKAWNIDAMGIEGEWSSYYFKTPKDAKADSKFMKYDCWMADIQKASSFSIPHKKECVVFYFFDGKVVKTEMRYPINE